MIDELHPRLQGFVSDCLDRVETAAAPWAQADALAPLMLELLAADDDFLAPAHRVSRPDHYARNLIFSEPAGRMSLFALVWLPGQWTPIHDHGTWGIVGVVEGMLEERSFMPDGHAIMRDDNIRLLRGGIILLTAGAVTSFVPNPDHIHETGVPEGQPTAVTLHIYGRNLNNYHVYDLAGGSRRLLDIPQYES